MDRKLIKWVAIACGVIVLLVGVEHLVSRMNYHVDMKELHKDCVEAGDVFDDLALALAIMKERQFARMQVRIGIAFLAFTLLMSYLTVQYVW